MVGPASIRWHCGRSVWGLLEAYAANKPLRAAMPQLVTQLLESGERSAAFCTNDNIAWRSKKLGKPTDYGFPAEGVPTELGAVGLLKDAQHPNAAILFYDWWMGESGRRSWSMAESIRAGRTSRPRRAIHR